MKKVLSKLFMATVLAGGVTFAMANSVYADIALPAEPSVNSKVVLGVVLVVVAILVALFAFTTKGFNKKLETNPEMAFGARTEAVPEVVEEGSKEEKPEEVSEENKEENKEEDQ